MGAKAAAMRDGRREEEEEGKDSKSMDKEDDVGSIAPPAGNREVRNIWMLFTLRTFLPSRQGEYDTRLPDWVDLFQRALSLNGAGDI